MPPPYDPQALLIARLEAVFHEHKTPTAEAGYHVELFPVHAVGPRPYGEPYYRGLFERLRIKFFERFGGGVGVAIGLKICEEPLCAIPLFQVADAVLYLLPNAERGLAGRGPEAVVVTVYAPRE